MSIENSIKKDPWPQSNIGKKEEVTKKNSTNSPPNILDQNINLSVEESLLNIGTVAAAGKRILQEIGSSDKNEILKAEFIPSRHKSAELKFESTLINSEISEKTSKSFSEISIQDNGANHDERSQLLGEKISANNEDLVKLRNQLKSEKIEHGELHNLKKGLEELEIANEDLWIDFSVESILHELQSESSSTIDHKTIDHIKSEVKLMTVDDNSRAFTIKNGPYESLFIVSRESKSDPQAIKIGMVKLKSTKSEDWKQKKIDDGKLRSAHFGKGTFGKAYQVNYLNSTETAVMKLSRKLEKSENAKGGEIALADNISEAKTMKYIQNSGNVQGLHSEIYDEFLFNDKQYIVISKKFDGDGDDLTAFLESSSISPHQLTSIKHSILDQLSQGDAKLKELGLIHRDIKPGNIFFSKEGSGVNVVIADMGNARLLEDVIDFSEISETPTLAQIFGGATGAYMSQKCVDVITDYLGLIDEILADIQSSEVTEEESKNCWFDIGRCSSSICEQLSLNDTFALGLSIYKLLTNEYPPFESFELKGPDFSASNDVKKDMEEMYRTLVLYSNVSPEDANKILDMIRPGLETEELVEGEELDKGEAI